MTDSANPLLAAYREALAQPKARSELRGWCALAVASLAVAGVFALLLALSRTPGVDEGVPWPLAFFGKGLVVHVVFAFVIFFLAVLGVLMHIAAWRAAPSGPRIAWAGRVGLVLAVIACVLLFLPAFLDRGEPSLNNYIPAIVDPVYYMGLFVLAAGIALPAARLLATPVGRGPDGLTMAAIAAAVVFSVALICFGIAYAYLAGERPSHAFNEELFWGGGHMMQFLSTLMMLGAWWALARLTVGEGVIPDGIVKVAIGFLLLFSVPSPILYFVLPPFSADQTQAFSALLWALGPAAFGVALAGLLGLKRLGGWRSLPWGEPAFLALVLSVVVFGVGGVLGMFIDGTDTRTPAHYHGVIAGVMLAMMGLFFGLFLPLLGRAPKPGRMIRFLIAGFAGGQTVACLGLFLAGGYGAPRKVAGDAQGLHDIGAIVGMSLNGLGGVIAVIGGVLFIWVTAKALLGRPAAE